MRGVVSAGMVWALEELRLTSAFDVVYGSSAGALNAEMEGLVAQRDAWIAEELARRAATDGADDFDIVVTGAIRSQAAEAGIEYRE